MWVLNISGKSRKDALDTKNGDEVDQIKYEPAIKHQLFFDFWFAHMVGWPSGLTKKAEPPPTGDVDRDSGTASANGG